MKGFEGCFDQLLKRRLRLVILGKMESIMQQQMLKKNDNRRVKDERLINWSVGNPRVQLSNPKGKLATKV